MNLYQIPFSKLPLFLLFTISIFLISCEEDTGSMQTEEVDYGYTAIINTPIDDATYTLGDTMFISVEYISTTKEIVHNVSVDIYSKSDNSINLYSVNTHKHVPEKYTYEDFFILNDESKINANSEWIINASMWSHEMTPDTISITKSFNVIL